MSLGESSVLSFFLGGWAFVGFLSAISPTFWLFIGVFSFLRHCSGRNWVFRV